MTPFTFVHASDLHLGSPFRGVYTLQPEVAALLQAATFEAFDALISLCIEKSVTFLLVSGDIFDAESRSLRAQLTFRDGLARLAEVGIPSFVTFGNHDPWEAWSANIHWPEGAHVFGPDAVETVIVPIDGKPAVAVSGVSFRSHAEPRRLADLYEAENPNLFQVAMLHTNCGEQQGHDAYAPCRVGDLRQTRFDYWALGHVHEKKILGAAPYIVYPGSIQGLHIKESDAHGCYLVSVKGQHDIALDFCPLDRVRWQRVSVSIEGHEDLDRLDQSLLAVVDDRCRRSGGRPVICQISLDGRGPLYHVLHQPGIVEEILDRLRAYGLSQTPPFWVQKVTVECLPEMNLAARMTAEDLLGQLLKTAEEMKQLKDQELISETLEKVYNHRRFQRYLKGPPHYDKLLRDVQLLCIDLLEPSA